VEAELRADYPDILVELIPGSNGIFDVLCDGKMIFSKQDAQNQRFPEPGEVSSLIKKGES
jgi:selT/selW/selH-like putative selenoprotein